VRTDQSDHTINEAFPGGKLERLLSPDCVERLRCPKIRSKFENTVPEIDPSENPVRHMRDWREDVQENPPYSAGHRDFQHNLRNSVIEPILARIFFPRKPTFKSQLTDPNLLTAMVGLTMTVDLLYR
jgi:hypothetical protein